MNYLTFLAEQRIQEAVNKGDITPESLKYKPLKFDDDTFVPEDLKMAYKILKNSGYLPPEVEERKEVEKLEDLIAKTEDEHERLKQMKKLGLLLMKIDSRRGFKTSISSQNDYYNQIVNRITIHKKNREEK